MTNMRMFIKAEKREKIRQKQRNAPKGGTLGGVKKKLEASKGFLRRKKHLRAQ
jgi:hypothetical protein